MVRGNPQRVRRAVMGINGSMTPGTRIPDVSAGERASASDGYKWIA